MQRFNFFFLSLCSAHEISTLLGHQVCINKVTQANECAADKKRNNKKTHKVEQIKNKIQRNKQLSSAKEEKKTIEQERKDVVFLVTIHERRTANTENGN